MEFQLNCAVSTGGTCQAEFKCIRQLFLHDAILYLKGFRRFSVRASDVILSTITVTSAGLNVWQDKLSQNDDIFHLEIFKNVTNKKYYNTHFDTYH